MSIGAQGNALGNLGAQTEGRSVSNGFVVLHRSIQDHPRYGRGDWFKVFADMEMEAAHRGYKKEFDGKIIFVKPGQLITDRASLGEKLGIRPSTLEDIWAKMKADGDISWEARPGSQGRLFTMHGYVERQARFPTANSIGKSPPSPTAKRQRSDSEATAIIGAQQWNNDNKGNNDDDKAQGSSLAGERPSVYKSSSSDSDWIKEAEKDELFPQYASFATTLNEKGWKTWRSKHSPKPKPKRKGNPLQPKPPPIDPVKEAEFQRRLKEWKAAGRPLGAFPE